MKKPELPKNLRTRRSGYRIRLRGTDLFFTPSRTINNQYLEVPYDGTEKVKSNLCERGKIYSQYPNIGNCIGFCYSHIDENLEDSFDTWKVYTSWYSKHVGWSFRTQPEDWIVEDYEN